MWDKIKEEYLPYIGHTFTLSGRDYVFFGLVDGGDDYYYGMTNKVTKETTLYSCVGSLKQHGFVRKDNER
jgi:hypothetical protein